MTMSDAGLGRCLRRLAIVLGGLGLLALLLFAAARHPGAQQARIHPHAVRVKPALPTGPAPIAEPMKIAALTPAQARASNAAVPPVPGAVEPAKPFAYLGTSVDHAAAQACLAAAVYYEAGDDAVGEQAVAQVVLNRLRHPAFPKTVCGVVFAGAGRKTGCQFTFTCDGSLTRVPPLAAWARAREIAAAALSGSVDKAVGLSTYYHAEFVVPYWRDTLDKVATVHSQIFYRWRGGWGRPGAFSGRYAAPELIDPRIVGLAGPAIDAPIAPDVDAGPAVPRTSLAIAGVPRAALKGAVVRLKDDDAGQYVLQLAPGAAPSGFAVTAFTICADKPDCLVLAWADERDTPRVLPVLPMAMRSLAFLYRKSSVLGTARPAWDCRRYPRSVRGQCLPGSG
ncbi:cell wall hydrolase [uncultured Sphingomonas sp.]|uniref:cell wall hydrolase n=1 Tax=uncultured Sphingomonas sp. TaxID=158754 RepID=UPI0026135CC9|nr:cell wall hydrolase [uncultured Sphingomonas sp.]